MAAIALTNATISASAASGSVIGTFNVSGLQVLKTDPNIAYFSVSGKNLIGTWSSPPTAGIYKIWVFVTNAQPAAFNITIAAAAANPTPKSITLTPASVSVPDNSAAGLLLSKIAVQMSDNSAFAGTLTIPANALVVVTGASMVVKRALVAGDDGAHRYTVTATQNGKSASASLALTVTAVAPPPPPPPSADTFYRGVNLGGGVVTIDGNAWEAGNAVNVVATGDTFAAPNVPLNPATDAARASMIHDSVYDFSGSNVAFTSVPPGTYHVYLYIWEDNNSETVDILLDGAVVRAGYVTGSAGHWDRLGPFTSLAPGGKIALTTHGGVANLSGIEAWHTAAAPPPPRTMILSFSPSAPQIPDNSPAGTVISTATVTYSDGTSPAAVTLTSSDTTFVKVQGMQSVLARAMTTADDGTHSVTITASDGLGALATARLFGGDSSCIRTMG